MRYLMPLCGIVALVLAARAYGNEKTRRLVVAWVIVAIALKYVFALWAFPYYTKRYRADIDVIAKDILSVTQGKPLWRRGYRTFRKVNPRSRPSGVASDALRHRGERLFGPLTRPRWRSLCSWRVYAAAVFYNTGMTDKDRVLLKIAEEISGCRLCKGWGTGLPVAGEGSADADVMFIGEAPGREEAKTGRPFIGRSGRLLRTMIAETGLKEEEVYITSPVKYLPLRGTPSRENIIHSRRHLMKQIEIIDPRVIVLLGSTACLALLDRKVAMTKERGTRLQKDGRTYFLTYHPAYALRFPAGKDEMLADFRKLRRLLRPREKRGGAD